MADWIDNLKQEIGSIEQERNRQAEALHSAAYRTWDFLKRRLDADIEKVNQNFSNKLGNLTLTMPESNQLLISKANFPAHYVTVTLDVAGKTLKIEREGKASQELRRRSAHPEYLKLGVNDDGDLVISHDGHDLDWEALPEMLLKPIIIGEEI